MYNRFPYSQMVLSALIVFLILFAPGCGNVYERVDVYIINCTEDNLRIENFTTNLHLENDCVDWMDAYAYPHEGGAYLASLDANISTKTFTFTRSIWNYKNDLTISINAEALKALNLGFDDVPPKVVITLREIEDPDTGNPVFTHELNGNDDRVGFSVTIKHNYD